MGAEGAGSRRALRDLLQEAESSLLECQVCFERFDFAVPRRPRSLPCGHVVCASCMDTLAHRGQAGAQLECPFCRGTCPISGARDCLPVLQLLELLASSSQPVLHPKIACKPDPRVFGGWGTLVNPKGLALCPQTRRIWVVHEGQDNLKSFHFGGTHARQITRGQDFLKYPLDVTVCSNGHVVVTDAGDRAVKIFQAQSGCCQLVLGTQFSLPWGVAATPEDQILVTDAEAGTLQRLDVDFRTGVLQACTQLLGDLCGPKAVAVCASSGAVAVLECPLALQARSCNSSSTTLKVFDAQMQLLALLDTLGFSLFLPTQISMSAVAFDHQGNVVVAETRGPAVLCLGKPNDLPVLRPLVTQGLARPVALAFTKQDSLLVLDSETHSVKIYGMEDDDNGE